MARQYNQRTAGEAFKVRSPWTIRCCSCGLTHTLFLRKNGKQLQGVEVIATLEHSATRAARRSKRWRHVKV